MRSIKWFTRAGVALAIGFLAIWLNTSQTVNQNSVPKAKAGAISSITVTPSNNSVNTNADYTIAFTTASDLLQYGYVYMVFRGNDWGYFDTYSASLDYIKVDGATSIKLEKSYFSGNNLAFTVPYGNTLAGGSAVEIKLLNVRNPYYAGGYQLQVYTNRYGTDIDGSYSNRQYMSDTFTIGTISVHGTATLNGVAQSGMYLSLYDTSYQHYAYSNTNSDGYYELGDTLPAGSYSLQVSPPWDKQNIKRYTATLTLDGTNQLKDITLEEKTKTLSGVITGSDGTKISNAYIYANQSGTWDYAYANTDSNGAYSMKLSGGAWSVSLSGGWDGTWVNENSAQNISFTNDQSAESSTLNLTVTIPDCTVSGTMVLRDANGNDTAITSGGVSIYQNSAPWSGFYKSLYDTNVFSGKLIAGKFKVYPWSSDNSNYLENVYQQNSSGGWDALNSQVLAVKDSDTSLVIKIVYSQKTDHISGQVVDENGTGVQGANVYGWKNSSGSYDWANATTDSSGNYDLLVSPGEWQINVYPNWNSNYTYLGKPLAVTVVSGTSQTSKNFTFMTLNATINGTVVDTDGAILSSLNSWAYIDTSDMGQEYWYSNVGASVTNGKFTMKVPAGTHKITVGWGGQDYSPGDSTSATVAANGSQEINVVMLKNDATITGYLKDVDGNAVTGQWAWVNASNNRHSWAGGSVDTATGQYTMKVAAGSWFMSFWVDYNSGYASQLMDDNKVTIASGQTIVKDITLRKIDSRITGSVKKYDDTGMENIPVSFDTRSGKKKDTGNKMMWYYANTAWTDAEGNFSMNMPAGTYYVNASMPYWQASSQSLINPEEQQKTVDASNPATANLVFRQVDSQISGTVTLDGATTSAYVWAWAEKGGGSDATAGADGTYSVNATKNDIWHIGAVKENDQTVYMSSEYLVETEGNATNTQNISLTAQNWPLPDSISSTFDPTKLKTISLSDGTVISIPANACVTDADNPPATVTFTATPSATLPSQKGDKPLWYGYDFSVTEPDGTQVITFNSDITISFPFTDAILTDKGLTEDDLTLKYYNETTGEWEQVATIAIDRDNNTVTISIDHFTVFAITTDVADTTAPSAPTGITATAGSHKATLAWTNPSDADFAGIKIYRSTTSGALGDLVVSTVSDTTASYENTTLTAGTTYYYTVRSYDTTGNISQNATQVFTTPTDGASASTSSVTALPETGSSSQIPDARIRNYIKLQMEKISELVGL